VSRTALGPTRPPIKCVAGALSLEVKRPGREAEHLPPSGAEVKNAWSYTSTSLYAYVAWWLVKHRENFTFINEITHKPTDSDPCVWGVHGFINVCEMFGNALP
jgi:hypothetical protein